MSEDILTIRSSIKTSLLNHTLFRGTIIAGIGGAILLFAGVFVPLSSLNTWGFPIFLASLALITLGLLPYKRLKRLEVNPYEIVADHEKMWHFFEKGMPLFSLPVDDIEKTVLIEKEYLYGIGVILKKPLPLPIAIHRKAFSLEDYEKESLKKCGCDVFFPYFSKRAYQELLDFQSPD